LTRKIGKRFFANIGGRMISILISYIVLLFVASGKDIVIPSNENTFNKLTLK